MFATPCLVRAPQSVKVPERRKEKPPQIKVLNNNIILCRGGDEFLHLRKTTLTHSRSWGMPEGKDARNRRVLEMVLMMAPDTMLMLLPAPSWRR